MRSSFVHITDIHHLHSMMIIMIFEIPDTIALRHDWYKESRLTQRDIAYYVIGI